MPLNATPELIPTTSELAQIVDELSCYEQTTAEGIDFPAATFPSATITDKNNYQQHLKQHCYLLPSGKLRILNTTLYLSSSASRIDIEGARQAAIKSALSWQKRCLLFDKEDNRSPYRVLIIDVQLSPEATTDNNNNNLNNSLNSTLESNKENARLTHSFGARYFMEELLLDINDTTDILPVFSWQDWRATLSTIKTPCEIWRFLSFYNEQLQQAFAHNVSSFESERHLLEQFLNSATIFTQAIRVDNALIKYEVQADPNAALVTMSLAQKNSSFIAQMYQQHMQQAAQLWSQLSLQMIELHHQNKEQQSGALASDPSSKQWQQQLLDESLFSRHELVRTIYKHPKQSAAMIEKGYVVHQHSYESLGRHYVLIFYGQQAQQSRATIQPNLATIAQDVATRLPLVELHHIVVLGIEFVSAEQETFIDIDLWIQPITAMTPKERQLTKKLQHLNQKNKEQQNKNQQSEKQCIIEHTTKATLPSLKLNLTVPKRSNK